MWRPLTLLLALLALGLAACGKDDASLGATTGGPATASIPSAAPTDTEVPADTAPAPATAAPDTAAPDAPAADDGSCAPKEEESGDRAQECPVPTLAEGRTNVVTLTTTEGPIEITLDAERAPRTTNSFASLTKKGFYDGLVFHRVVPGFVIQGGDPIGTTEQAGTGGPGYQVVEPPPADLKYTRGVVAMAKGGADAPGASGSQFFIVSAADVGLPPEYALVGKVTEGLGVVDRITALGEGDGPPTKEVKITSAKLSAR